MKSEQFGGDGLFFFCCQPSLALWLAKDSMHKELMMKRLALAAACTALLSVIALPAGASACRSNDWQPTYAIGSPPMSMI